MPTMDTMGRLLRERFPVFERVPEPLWGRICDDLQPRRVGAGERLFDRRMPCEGFPLVLDGSIRVSTLSAAGREIVLYRVGPGEGCILSGGCLLSHAVYSARGTAESDVTLVRLSPQTFDALMGQSDDFRRFVFDMYGNRLAEVMELVEEVAFRKLDTRLARLLIQQGPLVASTHQRLADELGSVRVFVSRVLRSFEERGWVRLERERIAVTDPRALAEFARS